MNQATTILTCSAFHRAGIDLQAASAEEQGAEGEVDLSLDPVAFVLEPCLVQADIKAAALVLGCHGLRGGEPAVDLFLPEDGTQMCIIKSLAGAQYDYMGGVADFRFVVREAALGCLGDAGPAGGRRGNKEMPGLGIH